MSAGPPAPRGVLNRLAQHPGLVPAALVLTIVPGLLAIATFGLDVFDRLGNGSAAPVPSTPSLLAPSPGVVTQSSPPSPSAPETAANTTTSVCLDGQQREVDCREPHRFEKFEGSCSTAGMLGYMSGRAGLDVVLATVRPMSGACVIDNPVEVAETASGVLAGSRDDAWLRCLDDRQRQLVPCSENHTGEYIATGESGKASQAECKSAAEAYLDQPLTNISDLLTVRVVSEVDPDPNSPRCLIAVRGTQPLTASVRNLGVSPVPIRR